MSLSVEDCPRCGSNVELDEKSAAGRVFACVNVNCAFLLTVSNLRS